MSTRHPSGETPPGIGCLPLLVHLYPEARPRRVLIACSASRSSSSTRQRSHGAPPLTGSYQMGPGQCRIWKIPRSHCVTRETNTIVAPLVTSHPPVIQDPVAAVPGPSSLDMMVVHPQSFMSVWGTSREAMGNSTGRESPLWRGPGLQRPNGTFPLPRS